MSLQSANKTLKQQVTRFGISTFYKAEFPSKWNAMPKQPPEPVHRKPHTVKKYQFSLSEFSLKESRKP
jgi:hypothetical protein